MTKAAASVCTWKVHRTEEVAIANPESTTILSDSRTAVRNYARGRVSSEAARILRAIKLESHCVAIKWFPAHMGEDVSERGNANDNETANAVVRGLTNRAAATGAVDPTWWCETKDNTNTYNEITKWYRHERRTTPPPHPA